MLNEQDYNGLMEMLELTEKDIRLCDFIEESNAIEGITRKPTTKEVEEASRFLELEKITVHDISIFVSVYQPDAKLRDQAGLNVKVSSYYPPRGGVDIRLSLVRFCEEINDSIFSPLSNDPFLAHNKYESLHPFTDCNGRSGRIIWLWQMFKLKKPIAPMGFLQSFYYQSLNSGR